MITAVIFDLDGVVVDSEPLYQEAEERLFASYGLSIPPEDWELFRGSGEDYFYRLVIERYQLSEELETLRSKGRRYVLSVFRERLAFMDGFADIHPPLRACCRLGLVTSSPDELYRWMDAKLGLSPHFDEVISGGMTTHSKPHPEPYQAMMRRLQVRPEQTVIIEDSIPGLNAALASGAWTVALLSTPSAGSGQAILPGSLPAVHAKVQSLREITPATIQNLPLAGNSAAPSSPPVKTGRAAGGRPARLALAGTSGR